MSADLVELLLGFSFETLDDLGSKEGEVGKSITPAHIQEATFSREDLTFRLCSEPGILDRFEWSEQAALAQNKLRMIFTDVQACVMVVHAIAAQAARGMGLESCTLNVDQMWKPEDTLGQEASEDKKQSDERLSKDMADSMAVGRPGAPRLLYAVPLLLKGSEKLPYANQMRAAPGARDHDVSSVSFRANLTKNLLHVVAEREHFRFEKQ